MELLGLNMSRKRKSVKLKNNKCPRGYIKRKGYTRKNTGKHVVSTCIRSTSPYASTPVKRKSRKSCPSGKIPRASYTRHVVNSAGSRKSVRVKSTCVKGSTPTQTIGPLRKGELKKFGYSYKLPESMRHHAMKAAIKNLGALDVYRKLDAVAKLSATKNKQAHVVFSADRDWIRAHWVLKAF
jgi:hypothetical protein